MSKLLEEEKELHIQDTEFSAGVFPGRRNFLLALILLGSTKVEKRKEIPVKSDLLLMFLGVAILIPSQELVHL